MQNFLESNESFRDRTKTIIRWIWYKKQLILVVFDMFFGLECYDNAYILYIFQCLIGTNIMWTTMWQAQNTLFGTFKITKRSNRVKNPISVPMHFSQSPLETSFTILEL